MEEVQAPIPLSASGLLRPVLEKIKQNVTGRKYAKLQDDLESLLEKLDVLLAGAGPLNQRRETARAPSLDRSATPPPPPSDSVGVSLEDDGTGRVSLNLTPPPLPASENGNGRAGGGAIDSGHMPSSPMHVERHPGALPDGAAREMMLVLHDAVETRKPVVMEMALDCLQKLVAFKLVQGPVYSINHKRESVVGRAAADIAAEGPAAPLQFAAQPPQAQAVELMCSCDDTGDEAVELRLLKALLTAATSPTLPVHGQALLLAVRACYNIFLTSRSQVAQATAKATLTQVLTVVFQRLEAGTLAVVVPPIAVADVLGLPAADNSSMSAFVQQFLADVAIAVDPFGTAAEGLQAGLDDAFLPAVGEPSGPAVEDLLDPSDPIDAQRISWRAPPEAASGVAATAAGEPRTPEKLQPLGGGGGDAGTESDNGSMMGALSSTAAFTPGPATVGPSGGSGGSLQSVLEKDAFLVFRALCKLSIRSADASPGSEATTLRGKVLALELLKILLENSGPEFRSGERFLGAIKQYLCLSLLKNCASTAPQAQHLCASIFLTLVTHFRQSLKAEIGVFFPMILLRPIEPPPGGSAAGGQGGGGSGGAAPAPAPSTPADTAQKAVALRCLQALCADGQMLVDLFVNYDCDLGGANLFERTVTAVVRVAQGTHPHTSGGDGPEAQALRYEALRFLASALGALTDWYDASVGAAALRAAAAVAAAGGAEPLGDDDGSSRPLPTAAAAAAAPELGALEDGLRAVWMERLASGQGGAPMADAGPGFNQAELLQAWKAFKKVFEEGIALFNKKPKKGLAFLQAQRLVGEEPEAAARFLAATRGLDKTTIGDFLGEREDYALKVMHAYVDALDFTGTDFDAAIRTFLSGFRLPGEAQKIDRLMEKFAERFVRCNPEAFKSADVAYVLAYSVIMLNTDAHNPMVKTKMSKSDFLRNNRGINDGGDLPQEFMEALYDRIINNEIKMKDEVMDVADNGGGVGGASSGWLDTMMALIPGRQRAATAEPAEAAIRRTADFLREQAKGATFFEARDGEAVRPMVDVAWAPMLGAFSVLFEEEEDSYFVAQCLEGFVAAVAITSRLGMGMLRSTFVSSLARFTMLHAPTRMRFKHAQAFRALLRVADSEGNALGDDWLDILRCVSRFELLLSLSTGVPTDASLFAVAAAPPGAGATRTAAAASSRGNHASDGAIESSSSIADMALQMTGRPPASSGTRDPSLPPASVLMAVDAQELNRFFVDSGRLNSDAVVGFVATLCSVAQEELRPGGPPRVFSLTKLVEIAHFNMGRIRLVWGRIWAVLSDFFVTVGCHESLAVAMYAVDSLRQLAMKFLERDELANYTFQNDFLRPFVVLVRRSKSAEIRELVIRCVSQMVLARAANIKSGWKSVFMVFTCAASDESAGVVRLAFDTVEKIVREHFALITETDTTTFTDCVNCLVAFTNNPHSLDVSLNAIAFLRFCAGELAEGDIGIEELGPEGLPEGAGPVWDPNAHRIRPVGSQAQALAPSKAKYHDSPGGDVLMAQRSSQGGIRFTDRDEHMYFWFPLLAGLSELTFDPRQEIRYGALGVLFDILKFHGGSFTRQFWARVYDSVLLPMFDHVRAEVTDTTTFTDEARRAEVDAWLYETCTATLQHIVEVVARYHAAVPELLGRTLDLLAGLVRRNHSALAAVGVAALARLALACGQDSETWDHIVAAFGSAADDTAPGVGPLIQHRMACRSDSEVEAGAAWSLGKGAGARRLAEVKCRAGTQLLLAQACGEVYAAHSRSMPTPAAVAFLGVLQRIAESAIDVDADVGLRHSLLVAQAADSVVEERTLPDPPLLRLEVESAQAYLSVLMTVTVCGPEELRVQGDVEARLAALCVRNLERFEQQSLSAGAAGDAVAAGGGAGLVNGDGAAASAAALAAENEALAPLAVATLKALLSFSSDAFKSRIKDLFPILTNLISCEVAPPEVQKVLSELFATRISQMVL